MWDSVAQKLHDKGGIGILINLAILAVLLVLRWLLTVVASRPQEAVDG